MFMSNDCETHQHAYAAGTISVKAVLEEHKRKICRLLVNPSKRSRDIAYIISLAKRQDIPVEFLKGEELSRFCDHNGGVVLECENRELPSLQEAKDPEGLCVYISGVEDPYNLGGIARSLYAAGASMMIVFRRDWSNAQTILLRSSAGAWERLPVYVISDEEQLLDWQQKSGLALLCASRDDKALSLFETGLPQTCLLAVGGAMRGLSSKILSAVGVHLYIPYGREFRNALDSVSALSVFAFSWTREHAARH